jgi:hypothetical protein
MGMDPDFFEKSEAGPFFTWFRKEQRAVVGEQ